MTEFQNAHSEQRITDMRDDGMTLVAIAEKLTVEKVPTARGGTRWWPSPVNSVLSRFEVAGL